ncbi:hypothetical protein H920_04032 [Fukomys damarensis]|uniref:Uncharacterized protein n=1 Tax=Fukomys damarensis TaxID=885580 RepID=A0A091DQZ0_FUKDA|nr:hypothetical protein H920_04032 [Fukomys damarensis]
MPSTSTTPPPALKKSLHRSSDQESDALGKRERLEIYIKQSSKEEGCVCDFSIEYQKDTQWNGPTADLPEAVYLSVSLNALAQGALRLTPKCQASEEINNDLNGTQWSIREDPIVSEELLKELLLFKAGSYNHGGLGTTD